MQTNQTTKTERNDTADRTARLARCAEALRRHGFEAVVTKDAQEAFERLRAAVEAEMPELVSFGEEVAEGGLEVGGFRGRRFALNSFCFRRPEDVCRVLREGCGARRGGSGFGCDGLGV